VIIGPFFIEDNLKAENYLIMLRDEIIPAINTKHRSSKLQWYQQDEAPLHFTSTL